MFSKSASAKATVDETKNKKSKEEIETVQEEKEEIEEIAEEEKTKEEEYLEDLKRCQADFDNYRKRQDERMKELGNLVKEDLVLQLFPVLDNFEMSLSHVPEDQKENAWVTGMMHIQRQLETVLKENGIEEIEVKEGDEFDPEIHEAIHNEESRIKNQELSNRVSKIIAKGYRIGDKVIRAAKVIVE